VRHPQPPITPLRKSSSGNVSWKTNRIILKGLIKPYDSVSSNASYDYTKLIELILKEHPDMIEPVVRMNNNISTDELWDTRRNIAYYRSMREIHPKDGVRLRVGCTINDGGKTRAIKNILRMIDERRYDNGELSFEVVSSIQKIPEQVTPPPEQVAPPPEQVTPPSEQITPPPDFKPSGEKVSPVSFEDVDEDNPDIFRIYISKRDSQHYALCRRTQEGFYILKGSPIKDDKSKLTPPAMRRVDMYIREGKIVNNIVQEDILITSSSTAAMIVKGLQTASGPDNLITKDGVRLKEILKDEKERR
jgi:hypothetical protein